LISQVLTSTTCGNVKDIGFFSDNQAVKLGKCCIHSVCGHSKDIDQFSDNQAKWSNTIRICLSCRISNKVYTKSLLLTVNGEKWIGAGFVSKVSGMAEVVGKLDEGGYLPE